MSANGRLTEALKKRLAPIRAVLFDVEGTLVASGAVALAHGLNTKKLADEDRDALRRAVEEGLTLGIITSRAGSSVDAIAAAAGINDVYQGYLNKSSAYEEFKHTYDFADEEIAYMGDDILDLAVIKMAGFSAAPFNAHASVRIAAQFVCRSRGGAGAAAEMLRLLHEAHANGGHPHRATDATD